MNTKVFEDVLKEDEEIIFAEGVNKKAYIFKEFGFAVIGLTFFGSSSSIFCCISAYKNICIIYYGINLFRYLSNFCLAINYFRIFKIKKYFFAITNKRIIKKSGTFNREFVDYSLKNVGTVHV